MDWYEFLLLNKNKCGMLNGSSIFHLEKMEHWYRNFYDIIQGKFWKVRVNGFAPKDSKAMGEIPSSRGGGCAMPFNEKGNKKPEPEKQRDRSKF